MAKAAFLTKAQSLFLFLSLYFPASTFSVYIKCFRRHVYSSKHIYSLLFKSTSSRCTVQLRLQSGQFPYVIMFHTKEFTNHFCNCLKEIITHWETLIHTLTLKNTLLLRQPPRGFWKISPVPNKVQNCYIPHLNSMNSGY